MDAKKTFQNVSKTNLKSSIKEEGVDAGGGFKKNLCE